MKETTAPLDLVKARIALAHATEIKHQIRLMQMSGLATQDDYDRSLALWGEALYQVDYLEMTNE